MSSGMSEKSLDLFGQIVSQNVKDLAYTTDLLIEGKDRTIKELAQTIVALNEILSDATVIDRKTEARLHMMGARIDNAYDTLDRQARS